MSDDEFQVVVARYPRDSAMRKRSPQWTALVDYLWSDAFAGPDACAFPTFTLEHLEHLSHDALADGLLLAELAIIEDSTPAAALYAGRVARAINSALEALRTRAIAPEDPY